MTPSLLPLYAASLALIAILALFARHNKKTGWVKQRNTVVQDLLALQTNWKESDLQVAAVAPAQISKQAPAFPAALSPAEASAFSFQIANLQTALRQSGPQVEIGTAVEHAQKVLV